MAKINSSFSQLVKEEICLNNTFSIQRKKALLSAYIRMNGYLSIESNKSFLTLQTENAKVAKHIYQLIKEIYNPTIHFIYVKNKKLNKTTSYKTIIEKKVDDIFNDLELSFIENKISKNIVYNDDTIAGYLSGAFLASGSMNSPINSKYHLEIACQDEDFANRILKLFLKYKNTIFEPKIIKRRQQYVVYLKRSDKIGDFLIMCGAINACIEFENVRIDRDFVNNANRLTNLDTANMTKTVNVAKKQMEWINTIDKNLGIDNIVNKKIKILCSLRKNNESASLAELASLMSQSLNLVVSKSNVAHLFKKIEEMALKYVK